MILPIDRFIAKLKAMPPEAKEQMRRQITGEADEDMIRRGDVIDAIRTLRVGQPSLQSKVYQRALMDVQLAVGDLSAPTTDSRGDTE